MYKKSSSFPLNLHLSNKLNFIHSMTAEYIGTRLSTSCLTCLRTFASNHEVDSKQQSATDDVKKSEAQRPMVWRVDLMPVVIWWLSRLRVSTYGRQVSLSAKLCGRRIAAVINKHRSKAFLRRIIFWRHFISPAEAIKAINWLQPNYCQLMGTYSHVLLQW